jgi:branched-subunit amino acid ABC-type transport system permease component
MNGNPTPMKGAPMETFVREVASGLSVGAILFMTAAGLNLIWGVLRIMNFATGSVYMLGAYGAVVSLAHFGGGNAAFVLALLLVPVLMGVAGSLVEMVLLRRTYHRDDEDQQFMLTLAVSYIVSGSIVIVFGSQFRTGAPPPFLSGNVSIAGARVTTYTIFTILVGIAVAVGVWLLLHKTRIGLLTRAAVNDRDMVSVLGINVGRIYTVIFGIGIALGALGGVLVAPVSAVTSHLDLDILVPAFVVSVAGGLGNMGGALVAALAIGLLQSVLAVEASSWAQLSPYIVMTVALLARQFAPRLNELRSALA